MESKAPAVWLTSGNEYVMLHLRGFPHRRTSSDSSTVPIFSAPSYLVLRAWFCTLRQNSYFNSGVNAAFSWSATTSSFGCSRGDETKFTRSAPYSSNHSPRSASARASIQSSAICRMCLRLFAALFNCATMKDFNEFWEQSRRYWSGGRSFSGMLRPFREDGSFIAVSANTA